MGKYKENAINNAARLENPSEAKEKTTNKAENS